MDMLCEQRSEFGMDADMDDGMQASSSADHEEQQAMQMDMDDGLSEDVQSERCAGNEDA